MAIGYTLVYGIVELINFAHGEVFMIGSFISVALFDDDRAHEGTGGARVRRSARCSRSSIAMLGSRHRST